MAQNNHGNFARSLPLPRGFDGTRPEQWNDFSYKLKAYLNMPESDFTNYMNLAAASVEPVTDQRHVLEQEGGGRVPDERGIRMSRQLKHLLITLCNGPPLTVIQSADTENGFEVWRPLCRHYSPDPVASQYGALGQTLALSGCFPSLGS